MSAYDLIGKLKSSDSTTGNIKAIEDACYEAMNDDFNTPMVIAQLFEGARIINSINDGKENATAGDIALLKKIFDVFLIQILGVKKEEEDSNNEALEGAMQLLLSLRAQAKTNKDFTTSDKIRDELARLKFNIKDTKDGAVWTYEN
jgi:cysteinyl-tRNA synthetase